MYSDYDSSFCKNTTYMVNDVKGPHNSTAIGFTGSHKLGTRCLYPDCASEQTISGDITRFYVRRCMRTAANALNLTTC